MLATILRYEQKFRTKDYVRKKPTFRRRFLFALPIFPGSHPPSIVGADELNFSVRDGREPERRLWRIKRGRSECSGR